MAWGALRAHILVNIGIGCASKATQRLQELISETANSAHLMQWQLAPRAKLGPSHLGCAGTLLVPYC